MNKILFFDIETHRGNNWDDLSPALQLAWEHHHYDEADGSLEDSFASKAGLFPEFSRVIAISFGYEDPVTHVYKKKCYKGIDEVKDILIPVASALTYFKNQGYCLSGWNIFGFDIPFMCRRYIINGIRVPDMFNSYGKKPWELTNFDLMLDYRCSASYSTRSMSLEVVCAALGIPCKSEELSGSDMHTYDLSEMDWDELEKYCDEDVECCYKIYSVLEKLYY